MGIISFSTFVGRFDDKLLCVAINSAMPGRHSTLSGGNSFQYTLSIEFRLYIRKYVLRMYENAYILHLAVHACYMYYVDLKHDHNSLIYTYVHI